MSQDICRICYGEEFPLISPCNCKGIIEYIHPECLYKWIRISKIHICDICHSPYKISLNYLYALGKEYNIQERHFQINIQIRDNILFQNMLFILIIAIHVLLFFILINGICKLMTSIITSHNYEFDLAICPVFYPIKKYYFN
jgi:E3 ubiquitin-protein ligase DOA10